MTSKFNGKTEIFNPCRFETPKSIETKIGLNDFVIHPNNSVNFRGDRSKGVCSPNRWNITNLWLSVPSLPFSFFLFSASPTAKTTGRIYTIYTSNDADSPKDVPCEGLDDKNIVPGAILDFFGSEIWRQPDTSSFTSEKNPRWQRRLFWKFTLTVTHNSLNSVATNVPETEMPLNFTSAKIQDGRWRPCWTC